MKRNVYISYIHSESMNFKTKIIDRFKGRKYKSSEEAFTTQTTNILSNEDELTLVRKNVSRSDVTVVFITRSILESTWIPFEVEMSLQTVDPFNKPISPKGIVGVVIPDMGNDYSYMMKKGLKGIWTADKSKLPNIISANTLNEVVLQNKHNVNYDSYISIYRWEDFVRDYENCISIAYDKATKHFEEYSITYK